MNEIILVIILLGTYRSSDFLRPRDSRAAYGSGLREEEFRATGGRVLFVFFCSLFFPRKLMRRGRVSLIVFSFCRVTCGDDEE